MFETGAEADHTKDVVLLCAYRWICPHVNVKRACIQVHDVDDGALIVTLTNFD